MISKHFIAAAHNRVKLLASWPEAKQITNKQKIRGWGPTIPFEGMPQ
jgi:hypothetical protein